MAVFTTTLKVRSLLGLASGVTVYDELLSTLVDVADQIIFDEIGLPADHGGAVHPYTEKFDVSVKGQKDLAVNYTPLVSVVAITTGGTNGSAVAADDYYITDYGQVRLIPSGAYWPVGQQIVEITYNAGFASIPADLQHAATLVAVHHFNEGPRLGFQSEKLGTYNYKLSNLGMGMGLPPIVNRILAKYKRIFARP